MDKTNRPHAIHIGPNEEGNPDSYRGHGLSAPLKAEVWPGAIEDARVAEVLQLYDASRLTSTRNQPNSPSYHSVTHGCSKAGSDERASTIQYHGPGAWSLAPTPPRRSAADT